MKTFCYMTVLVVLVGAVYAEGKVQCFNPEAQVGNMTFSVAVKDSMDKTGETTEFGVKSYKWFFGLLGYTEGGSVSDLKEKFVKLANKDADVDTMTSGCFNEGDTADTIANCLDKALSPKCNDDDKYNTPKAEQTSDPKA